MDQLHRGQRGKQIGNARVPVHFGLLGKCRVAAVAPLSASRDRPMTSRVTGYFVRSAAMALSRESASAAAACNAAVIT